MEAGAERRPGRRPAEGTQWLRAGRVGRPHGLDGSFYVGEAVPALLSAALRLRVGEELREIERRAGTDARPLVRLAGISDRTAAEALRGAELLVARAEAPRLGEDEWWAEELEGCRVRDGASTVGVVSRLLVLPSCEVLEVERAEGGQLLVPLVGDAVRSVDVSAGEIDVDLAFLGER